MIASAHLLLALQSIVSRNVDPLEAGVVSICMFHADNTDNVIPQTTKLGGTARSLSPKVRDLLEQRLHEVVERPDTPAIRGMIHKVRHLVEVTTTGTEQ